MAVKQIGPAVGENIRKLSGFTTDVKPKTDNAGKPLGNGSTFMEYDATTKTLKNVYKFHDGDWYAL